MEILNIAFIVWDPAREIFPFCIPWLGRPILWYGFLFALGFFLGYRLFLSILRRDYREEPTLVSFRDTAKKEASRLAERTLFAVGLGTLIGARLGDVLFYQDASTWLREPWTILYIWEGGLASHGAAIGIIIGLSVLASRLRRGGFQVYHFLSLLDRVVPCAALAVSFIRLGNFINQEIVGTPTNVPWAVIFLHPADGGAILPRHPVQLYEAIAYLSVFILLYSLWKWRLLFQSKGRSSGLFLVLLFGFRFILEFFKADLNVYAIPLGVTMGQLLSIPFLILGFWLLYYSFSRRELQES